MALGFMEFQYSLIYRIPEFLANKRVGEMTCRRYETTTLSCRGQALDQFVLLCIYYSDVYISHRHIPVNLLMMFITAIPSARRITRVFCILTYYIHVAIPSEDSCPQNDTLLVACVPSIEPGSCPQID